ncbi:hypothetical protein BJ508DRAFT_363525 [Ascobolus immersus RN42]|uniref:Uncharacterized protein n=1 Tax=Ascobolus immersus RN42 TaxID=1160509 RepID=A0A3N4HYF8_ASCIM|nr:hypothetical protein BJ508DRAFT_363525 [Ascobolus immersus RN42]
MSQSRYPANDDVEIGLLSREEIDRKEVLSVVRDFLHWIMSIRCMLLEFLLWTCFSTYAIQACRTTSALTQTPRVLQGKEDESAMGSISTGLLAVSILAGTLQVFAIIYRAIQARSWINSTSPACLNSLQRLHPNYIKFGCCYWVFRCLAVFIQILVVMTIESTPGQIACDSAWIVILLLWVVSLFFMSFFLAVPLFLLWDLDAEAERERMGDTCDAQLTLAGASYSEKRFTSISSSMPVHYDGTHYSSM